MQRTEREYRVRLADVAYWREQIKCQHACPVHTDARGYVRAIAEGDYRRAYLIARGPNPFASICGRICGAPCEAACRRGDLDQPIAIRALKRVATERHGPEHLLGELGATEYRAQYMDQAGSAVCDALDEIKHLLQVVQAPSWRKPDVGPAISEHDSMDLCPLGEPRSRVARRSSDRVVDPIVGGQGVDAAMAEE